MAKINFGGVVQDARGKQNGLVYSKNKSGAYVRRKVTPSNPRSGAQSLVRSNFATLSKAWSGTLTDSQRAQWIAYAATYPRLDIFGASIVISGLNMFISLNQVLMLLPEATITSPPASNVVTPVAFDPLSLVATATGTLTFNQTAAATASTGLYMFGAAGLPPGRTPQKKDFRYLQTFTDVAGPYPLPVDMAPRYIARFGAMIAGQKVSVLVATVDITTGLLTPGTMMTALVA